MPACGCVTRRGLDIFAVVLKFGSMKPSATSRSLDCAIFAAWTRGALTMAVLCLLLIVGFQPAEAQTETVLYSFCAQTGCPDGSNPRADLVMDTAGNLYGTTLYGGTSGVGTVFELSPSGTETVRHSFAASHTDGHYPYAGLLMDTKGNLYGTAQSGGAKGLGAVFKLSPNGTETLLYSFCVLAACADGYHPRAGLIMDTKGNLYGTAFDGGAYDAGAVFELSPSGTETVLHSFCQQMGCPDGYYPQAGLVMDTNGNLYGTTLYNGAYGGGTVFKISSDGTATTFYNFCTATGCKNGRYPQAGLILDTNGNLYGTTYGGGAYGKGTVFELSPSGAETVRHSFCARTGCPDGSHPRADLAMDTAGNLYGTTYSGGTNSVGTVFKLSPNGTETVLHSFAANGSDGTHPYAGLVTDTMGNLYGTTYSGGANGYGTVFKVTP
jgi:uncharacterized repeat protein (TIGR03803 family)